jgi:hypothetical protein
MENYRREGKSGDDQRGYRSRQPTLKEEREISRFSQQRAEHPKYSLLGMRKTIKNASLKRGQYCTCSKPCATLFSVHDFNGVIVAGDTL